MPTQHGPVVLTRLLRYSIPIIKRADANAVRLVVATPAAAQTIVAIPAAQTADKNIPFINI
jgi:hypothetical protein